VAATGIVTNIQKFSVHDGGGIRTLVFLKGCPLRCPWCSNPETQKASPETGFNPALCLGAEKCGRCLGACPYGLLRPEGGRVPAAPEGCRACGACVTACPSGARTLFGRECGAGEIVERVLEDEVFYRRSGGGLTLSGGEPLFQAGFAMEILREAGRWGVGTAIETSGCAPEGALLELAGLAGAVIFDLKHWDPAALQGVLGLDDPGLPAANLKALKAAFPALPVRVRIPVIPGFNGTLEDLVKTASQMPQGAGVPELLPYHRMGESKYALLGRRPPWKAEAAPQDPREFAGLVTAFRKALKPWLAF
jgi:pyruvate formate lyase activating enzyme